MADVNTVEVSNGVCGEEGPLSQLTNSDSMYNLEPHAEILAQFRAQVADVLKPEHDDYFLIRWLRARNFDIKKAEDMLRKSMAWRKRYNVDNILTEWEVPEVMRKYCPGGWSGMDKDGCPVFIKADGGLDIRGITMSCRKVDIILYFIWWIEVLYEKFDEQSKKCGCRVDKAILISDLEGFSLKQLMAPGMDTMLKVMGIIEANYPETLKTAYVVNAPRIWGLIFSLVKPFLSDYTKRKIVILGSDWKSKLLEHIDAEQLPVHWGGLRTDPDGNTKCQSEICPGGEVPESYYLSLQNIVPAEKLTHVTVAAGSSESAEFHITKPNCVLKYYFKTELHDINFGVSVRVDGSDDLKEVLPVGRRSCHLVPETGVVVCEQLGTYVFHFDNQFSWMRSKRLCHYVEILEASEEKAAEHSRKISMSM